MQSIVIDRVMIELLSTVKEIIVITISLFLSDRLNSSLHYMRANMPDCY